MIEWLLQVILYVKIPMAPVSKNRKMAAKIAPPAHRQNTTKEEELKPTCHHLKNTVIIKEAHSFNTLYRFKTGLTFIISRFFYYQKYAKIYIS